MPIERNNAVPFQSIDLKYEVAIHLFTRVFGESYALLYNNGDYVRVARGPDEKAESLVFASWAEALRAADVNCVDFIVNFKKRRVYFRLRHAAGGCTWPLATTYPPQELKALNHASIEPYEPDAEGEQPAQKRPSGAANRKRQRFLAKRVASIERSKRR